MTADPSFLVLASGLPATSDQLDELLRGLSARERLVYRLALLQISLACRSDVLFDRKTKALQAQLRLDDRELADILREAREVAGELAGAT